MRWLYLRTLFHLDTKAGGSIGHTAGVINELDKTLRLDVVSNADLPGVKKDITVITPPRLNFLPVYIREILYNFTIIKKLKTTLAQYDAVYQRYSGCSFAGAWLTKKFNLPFILEFNSSDVWKITHWTTRSNLLADAIRFPYRRLIKIPIISLIENYNLNQADLIVVVSEPLKENLIHLGIPEKKILVNPNGVDPEQYSPQVDGTPIRNHYHLEGKIVLGFIGTFGPWHGTEVLAQAFGQLIRQFPQYRQNLRLLMIGDGITMPTVKKNLADFNVADMCILTGLIPQEQGPQHLAACDILVSPHVPNPDGTKFFGSPTKLFEYMAMGKGIVASDLDQIGQILSHGRTAWMVKPGDMDSLVQGMKMLVDNKELRDALGKEARQEVLARHTWKNHTKNIIDKLRTITGDA